MFQDGALFGSMNLFDNIAFPLREHTKQDGARDPRRSSWRRWRWSACIGAEDKLPGEISGGMRKRAGLARALVLDPQIILCDEPDSGLDPVRTAYLAQLLIDLNAQIDATILIVTHNIHIAAHRAGQHRHAVPPGPGHVRPARGAADQRRAGGQAVPQRPPIGPDRDVRGEGRGQMAREQAPSTPAITRAARRVAGHHPAAARHPGHARPPGGPPRRERVREIMHTLPPQAQQAIEDDLAAADRDADTADQSRSRPTPTNRPGPVGNRAWGEPSKQGCSDRHRAGRAQAGNLFALVADVVRKLFRAAVPAARVHRAVLVHRERLDPADGAGRDPVRRGGRAAARLADQAARRRVVHRRGQRARVVQQAAPAGHRAADRRRGRLRDLRRPRLAHHPRGDRRDGGDRHLPDAAPGRAAGAGHDARRVAAQRPGLGGRHRRRLLLQRAAAGRHPGRLPASASPRSPSCPTCGSARSRR